MEEDLVYFRKKLCAALGVDEKLLEEIPEDPLKYDRLRAEKVLRDVCREKGFGMARVTLVCRQFNALNEAIAAYKKTRT
jgi:hypothetical protein